MFARKPLRNKLMFGFIVVLTTCLYLRLHSNVNLSRQPDSQTTMKLSYGQNSTCRRNWKGKFNVLFITVDDLRPDMECLGPNRQMLHTPAINSLASRSLVLRQAYCQYPSCLPSRMSLFTGRRPKTQRGYSNTESYRRTDIGANVFQYYKQHGYLTVAIGKSLHYRYGSFCVKQYEPMWSEDPILPKGRSSSPYWKSHFKKCGYQYQQFVERTTLSQTMPYYGKA